MTNNNSTGFSVSHPSYIKRGKEIRAVTDLDGAFGDNIHAERVKAEILQLNPTFKLTEERKDETGRITYLRFVDAE